MQRHHTPVKKPRRAPAPRPPGTRRAAPDVHAATALRHRSRCLYFLNTNEDQRRKLMSEHVYKQIELTGSSTKSIDDAISTAIAKAAKTLRNLHWFEVVETRGQIEDDKVAYWQVTIKVGLRID
jgi:dodecin